MIRNWQIRPECCKKLPYLSINLRFISREHTWANILPSRQVWMRQTASNWKHRLMRCLDLYHSQSLRSRQWRQAEAEYLSFERCCPHLSTNVVSACLVWPQLRKFSSVSTGFIVLVRVNYLQSVISVILELFTKIRVPRYLRQSI